MEIGHCHECKFLLPPHMKGLMYMCGNKETHTDNLREEDSAKVLVHKNSPLAVGLNFGCVHFEQNIDEIENFEDNMTY
jgi:hypothetical protein